MNFDCITEDCRLWAVRYDGMEDNILSYTFQNWMDLDWLHAFFESNVNDLEEYFKITDIDTAIYDTVEDAVKLQCVILDISPEANLDKLFRPLDNNRTTEMYLGLEKAKGFKNHSHSSWLRLYAIKLEPQIYLITGGTIKLTHTMQQREHTLTELHNMEKVRRFLIEQGVSDLDGLKDYGQYDKERN